MSEGDDDGKPNPLAEYAGAIPADVASVYEALYRAKGTLPSEADQLYIWQAAVLLGVHRRNDEDDDVRRPTHDKRRLLRERVAHARGQGPPPEPRPVSLEQLATMRVDVVDSQGRTRT